METQAVQGKVWIPSAMETRCLSHLDHDDNWTQILHRSRPDDSEILGWAPFRTIFVINLVQFSIIFSIIFIVIDYASSNGQVDWRGDAFGGTVFVAVCAVSFAAYVAYLYRRSWNRRAKSIALDPVEE